MQSVRNGETLRDRSGRLDNINSQEVAKPQKFRHGKRWNRIGIVCRVKINRESGECSSAENFQRENRTRWDLRFENDWLGKTFRKYLFIGDERIIYFQRTKVYVFSDSVLCFREILQNLESNDAWERRLEWTADGIRVEHFPRIHNVAVRRQSQRFIERRNTRKIDRKNPFYRCSKTFLVEGKTMQKNVWHTLKSYLCAREYLVRTMVILWSWFWKRSGTLWKRTVHKEFWDNIEKNVVGICGKRMPDFPCYDTIVQRSILK